LVLHQLDDKELAAFALDAVGQPYRCADGYPAERTQGYCIKALMQGSFNTLRLWLFVTIGSGLAIGDCMFLAPDPSEGKESLEGEYGIAYQVASSHQGQRYGKEAVLTLSAWALQQAGINALQAVVERTNIASRKILVAAAFELTDRKVGRSNELWRRER